VAVVTGASSGVGRALAHALAGAGAHVVLVGRNADRLAEATTEARSAGGTAVAVPADLAAPDGPERLAALVANKHEAVDVLVHSAGVISLANLEASTVADLDEQYRTNLRAPYALTRALLPALRARQGHVVFINSVSGLKAPAGSAAYAATKHGLRALADSFREETRADGIRVL